MTRTPDITVILPLLGPDRLVLRAIESLKMQHGVGLEVVVLHRAGAALAVLRQLEEAVEPDRLLHSENARSYGRSLNQAVHAGTCKYFTIVDGSDVLQAGHFAAALGALDLNPASGYAVSRGAFHPPGGADVLSAMLANPWAFAAPVFRRSSWERNAQFDESLPGVVEWDLLITLEERREHGVVLDGEPGARYRGDDVGLRAALRPDRYLESIRRVFAKHQATFESRVADALVNQELVAKRLWSLERELVARRDRARSALSGAAEELARLRSELQPHGRSTLEWEDLRRTTPVSRMWGWDRGFPVDRYYIERFIEQHGADIRGDVLEVLDAALTTRFGGDRVRRSDVLDIDPGNPRATLIGDLRVAADLPEGLYDCFILTQTLHVIDDMRAAIANAYRMLKPGGVLLATLPAVSMVERSGDRWRMTEAGARDLFEPVFGMTQLTLRSHGNVLVATAFLYGLSWHELGPSELDTEDEAYPVIVTVRAVKDVAAPAVASARDGQSAVLLYHRVAVLADDPYQMAVAPDVFRGHLQRLCRECRIVPLSEIVDSSRSGEVPDRTVALTFDDGYLDNLNVAVPILQEFGVPATFFLTTETKAGRPAFWWDLLHRVLLSCNEIPLTLRIAGEVRKWETRDIEGRRAAHDELYATLKNSLPTVRDDILRQLRRLTGITDVEGERPIDVDEIRMLSAIDGVQIGAHTVHHVSLPAISDEHLFREVSECRTTLQTVTSQPVTAFAYPFGELSAAAVDMVSVAEYQIACTCEPRPLRRYEHPLRLPRIQAPAGSADNLMRLLSSQE